MGTEVHEGLRTNLGLDEPSSLALHANEQSSAAASNCHCGNLALFTSWAKHGAVVGGAGGPFNVRYRAKSKGATSAGFWPTVAGRDSIANGPRPAVRISPNLTLKLARCKRTLAATGEDGGAYGWSPAVGSPSHHRMVRAAAISPSLRPSVACTDASASIAACFPSTRAKYWGSCSTLRS